MSWQLNAAKKILRSAQGKIAADLTVRLWDGERIEFSRSDAPNIEIAFESAAAMRQMLLHPGAATLFGLFGSGQMRIENGSPLQFLRSFDHVSVAKFFRQARRIDLVRAAVPFLFRERGSVASRTFGDKDQGSGRDDRKMVQFHYDVSNDFYRLFLDDAMVYTCGYFRDWGNDIHTAQRDKLDHVCRKLRLQPGDRVLDIGCGWGAFAIHAAKNYGAIVKGVTLSQAQYDLAVDNVKQAGLSDRVTIEARDFRDLHESGAYDKIASLGMFEHVGRENFDAYFDKVNDLLRPRGLYLHHAITRRVTPKLSDFDKPNATLQAIVRYIFPGGELDHIGRTLTNLERRGF
jgi:cyclopropane-fatty-acyl-phospholipid synthase